VLPRTRRSITVASFVAALVSVPAAAGAFTLIYAIGGTTHVPVGKVLTAMVGVHVLIGIGEAVITMLTVGAVVAVRPDLVYGARGLTTPLKLRVGGELIDAPAAPAAGVSAHPGSPRRDRSPRLRTLWLTGLATALVLAGFVSFYASASPDGLEKVAADQGIDKSVKEHDVAGSPLADYGVKDISDPRLSGGLAGVIGVGSTVAVGTGIFWVVRRRSTPEAEPPRVPESV
jgi:cobalt/nickel transport system permease protein